MLGILFVKLFFASITGTAVFCVLLLLTRLFFSVSYSSARYYGLVLALIVTLLPISFDLHFATPSENTTDKVQTAILYEDTSNVSTGGEEQDTANKGSAHMSEYAAKIAEAVSLPWLTICVLLFIARLTAAFVFSARLKKDGAELNLEGIPKSITVMESGYITSPTLIYGVKPVIYLPAGGYCKDELESALAHELTHIKRKDIIVKYIMLIAKCLHFYNPFIYLMCREIERECEISCDSRTVEGFDTERRKKYVSDVLSLAGKAVKKHALSFGISSGGKELERRFNVILKNQSMTKRKKAIIITVCAVCALVLILTGGVMAGKADFFAKNKDEAADEHFSSSLSEEEKDGEGGGSLLPAASTSEKNSLQSTSTSDDGAEDGDNAKPHFFAVTISAPLDKLDISHGYDNDHRAVDFKAPSGTPVYSGFDGTVTDCGYNAQDGNFIIISDGKSTSLEYKHLSEILVTLSEKVSKGGVIGKVGTTGRSTGPHLHFEVKINGKNINPEHLWK